MFPFHDNNPTARYAVVTFAIIATNLVALLWLQSRPLIEQRVIVAQRGFVPARIEQLRDPRLVVPVPIGTREIPGRKLVQVEAVPLPPVSRQIYSSLFTCMFLHGGWMHLIGNMWFLYLFGNNIEDRLGHLGFTAIYLLGGLLATFAHWAWDPSSATPVIGASGAVAAVLGAYTVTYPHARVRTLIFLFVFATVIELPAMAVLGLWFLGQLLEGIGALQLDLDGGVAWWAHVGGFIAGAAMMPLFARLLPLPHEEPIEAELAHHFRD